MKAYIIVMSYFSICFLISEYDIVTAEADFTDSGIVIDTSTLKRASKVSSKLTSQQLVDRLILIKDHYILQIYLLLILDHY